MHTNNKEMGKHWNKQVVQKLALKSIDGDGNMNLVCWDLDKSFHVEDWGRDKCKRNWSLPKVDHNSSKVEHMVEGVRWLHL